MKIQRLNKRNVPNGTTSGVTTFQNLDDEKIYYKDINGNLKEFVDVELLTETVNNAVGLNNELSEILANGNTTGANNIIVSANQSIQSANATQTNRFAISFFDGGGSADTLIIQRDSAGEGGSLTLAESALVARRFDNLGNEMSTQLTSLGWEVTSDTATDYIFDGNISLKIRRTFEANFNPTTLTADRTYTFQDASGTVAFLSDVQAADALNEVLTNGNNSGGNNINMTAGDSIVFNNSSFTYTINPGTLTGNRNLTLPDANGTLVTTDTEENFSNTDLTFTGSRTHSLNGNQIDIQNSINSALKISDTGVVINDNNADINFTVNGDIATNLFVVDAGLDAVGIGGAPDGAYQFDVSGASNFGGSIVIEDGNNISLNTTTGTKIGTATTQKLGFWNATPVVQPATITQTYATASATHAARTAATLTDSSGGTANTTVAAVSGSGADATINDNFADVAAQINNLKTDSDNTAQVLNDLIDKLQSIGIIA